jgi:hypothetical protein
MKYCLAAADRFTVISDPYKQGRICFKFNHLERLDLVKIADDFNFLFIYDNVVYFKS